MFKKRRKRRRFCTKQETTTINGHYYVKKDNYFCGQGSFFLCESPKEGSKSGNAFNLPTKTFYYYIKYKMIIRFTDQQLINWSIYI